MCAQIPCLASFRCACRLPQMSGIVEEDDDDEDDDEEEEDEDEEEEDGEPENPKKRKAPDAGADDDDEEDDEEEEDDEDDDDDEDDEPPAKKQKGEKGGGKGLLLSCACMCTQPKVATAVCTTTPQREVKVKAVSLGESTEQVHSVINHAVLSCGSSVHIEDGFPVCAHP